MVNPINKFAAVTNTKAILKLFPIRLNNGCYCVVGYVFLNDNYDH